MDGEPHYSATVSEVTQLIDAHIGAMCASGRTRAVGTLLFPVILATQGDCVADALRSCFVPVLMALRQRSADIIRVTAAAVTKDSILPQQSTDPLSTFDKLFDVQTLNPTGNDPHLFWMENICSEAEFLVSTADCVAWCERTLTFCEQVDPSNDVLFVRVHVSGRNRWGIFTFLFGRESLQKAVECYSPLKAVPINDLPTVNGFLSHSRAERICGGSALRLHPLFPLLDDVICFRTARMMPISCSDHLLQQFHRSMASQALVFNQQFTDCVGPVWLTSCETNAAVLLAIHERCSSFLQSMLSIVGDEAAASPLPGTPRGGGLRSSPVQTIERDSELRGRRVVERSLPGRSEFIAIVEDSAPHGDVIVSVQRECEGLRAQLSAEKHRADSFLKELSLLRHRTQSARKVPNTDNSVLRKSIKSLEQELDGRSKEYAKDLDRYRRLVDECGKRMTVALQERDSVIAQLRNSVGSLDDRCRDLLAEIEILRAAQATSRSYAESCVNTDMVMASWDNQGILLCQLREANAELDETINQQSVEITELKLSHSRIQQENDRRVKELEALISRLETQRISAEHENTLESIRRLEEQHASRRAALEETVLQLTSQVEALEVDKRNLVNSLRGLQKARNQELMRLRERSPSPKEGDASLIAQRDQLLEKNRLLEKRLSESAVEMSILRAKISERENQVATLQHAHAIALRLAAPSETTKREAGSAELVSRQTSRRSNQSVSHEQLESRPHATSASPRKGVAYYLMQRESR
jgi:hypothetical protein